MSTIIAFLATFAVLIIGVGIVMYVFSALGLYTMAGNRGIEYKWIAWIPVVQLWLLGDLIDNKMWGFEYTNAVLTLGTVLTTILQRIDSTAGFGVVLGIVMYVYQAFCYNKLFKIYAPEHATLYTVLGVIFPFLVPIWYFVIRNNEPDLSVLAD